MAKIKRALVTEDNIVITTELGSVCELTNINASIIHNEEFPINFDKVPDDKKIFFFNRIKSRDEGKGEGSCLLKKLIECADENSITIINTINPYGKLNLQQLNSWYKKHGFEQPFEKQLSYVIRYPQQPKRN